MVVRAFFVVRRYNDDAQKSARAPQFNPGAPKYPPGAELRGEHGTLPARLVCRPRSSTPTPRRFSRGFGAPTSAVRSVGVDRSE